MELAKTLLLYGEIETLLRIQACPEVSFESKWNLPWECAKVYGWDEMMRSCLTSYIFLNVVYLHPEIWDVESKAKWIKGRRKAGTAIEEEEVDYRRMTSWSKVLSRCTGYLRYDVHTYPHRQFYGTNQDAYDGTRWNREGAGRWHRKPVIPGKPEVGEGDRYLPLFDDVDIVLFILRLKGLPTELGLQILTYADFKPERRLPVADDPFNPANKEELRKYLSWCWKVLVWTDVLMTASGRRIGWVYEVTDVINALWGDDKQIIRVVGEEKQARKMWRWGTHDEDDAENGTGESSIPGPRVIFH